ncbi:hypothetical protein SAMN05192588_0883 [Nonlabens sp. Hel1_33_55]|nr:hypothetical protein SAMN05192588_0883 [Nonlabens sp. Hel1_33_55]
MTSKGYLCFIQLLLKQPFEGFSFNNPFDPDSTITKKLLVLSIFVK